MIKKIYLTLILIAGTIVLYASVWSYFTLPIVGINSDGECAYIINSEGVKDSTCANIPNKYITEFVQ
jgi:hypothetical protein